MPINQERLEKRREELKIQQEQLRLNLVAVSGAIQDLDYLLSEKDDAEESEAEPKG